MGFVVSNEVMLTWQLLEQICFKDLTDMVSKKKGTAGGCRYNCFLRMSLVRSISKFEEDKQRFNRVQRSLLKVNH